MTPQRPPIEEIEAAMLDIGTPASVWHLRVPKDMWAMIRYIKELEATLAERDGRIAVLTSLIPEDDSPKVWTTISGWDSARVVTPVSTRCKLWPHCVKCGHLFEEAPRVEGYAHALTLPTDKKP